MKFTVRFTTDEPSLGPVFAALNSRPDMVVDCLEVHPLDPPLAPRQLPPPPAVPQPRGVTKKALPMSPPILMADIVLRCLETGPTHYGALGDYLTKHGFAKNSVSGAVFRLQRAGKVVRVAEGVYALAGSTAPIPPKPAHRRTGIDHALDLFADGKEHTFSEVEKFLKARGFGTFGSQMTKMSRTGLIERGEGGGWRLPRKEVPAPTLVPEEASNA